LIEIGGAILVRDSSAVRRLFVRLAGAVGRQSALHKENSAFAAPTMRPNVQRLIERNIKCHVSCFRLIKFKIFIRVC